MPILLIVIFWVVLIRPQQKRAKAQRERQASLKKGVSDGVFVKYDKTAIASVLNKDETSSES